MRQNLTNLKMNRPCCNMNGCRDKHGGRSLSSRRRQRTWKATMITTSGTTSISPIEMPTRMRNGLSHCINCSPQSIPASLKPTRWRVREPPTFVCTLRGDVAQKAPIASTIIECRARQICWLLKTTWEIFLEGLATPLIKITSRELARSTRSVTLLALPRYY